MIAQDVPGCMVSELFCPHTALTGRSVVPTPERCARGMAVHLRAGSKDPILQRAGSRQEAVPEDPEYDARAKTEQLQAQVDWCTNYPPRSGLLPWAGWSAVAVEQQARDEGEQLCCADRWRRAVGVGEAAGGRADPFPLVLGPPRTDFHGPGHPEKHI